MLHGGLEHRKIKTRLIDEKFTSVMGECLFVKLGLYTPSIFRVIRKTTTLGRILPHFDLRIEENAARR